MESTSALGVLAALGQGTRLETFQLLVQHEPDGLPAGEIVDTLAVPRNTMSAHLNILSNTGLVTGERQSRLIIYRANFGTLRDLMLFW